MKYVLLVFLLIFTDKLFSQIEIADSLFLYLEPDSITSKIENPIIKVKIVNRSNVNYVFLAQTKVSGILGDAIEIQRYYQFSANYLYVISNSSPKFYFYDVLTLTTFKCFPRMYQVDSNCTKQYLINLQDYKSILSNDIWSVSATFRLAKRGLLDSIVLNNYNNEYYIFENSIIHDNDCFIEVVDGISDYINCDLSNRKVSNYNEIKKAFYIVLDNK